jgi:rod shape-determining protein MreC
VFRFTRKIIFPVLGFVIPLLILAVFLPVLRAPAMVVLRSPLYLCSMIGREVNGILFYHRNYVERDRLAKRVDHLNSKFVAMYDLSAENNRLTTILSLKQQLPYKVVAARVIGRDPSNWSSTVIIDKGTSGGIKKGAAAVSYLGLVGRVIDAQPFTATVTLINDPDVSVYARIVRSRQEGLACGSLGGTLMLKLLPKDCDIVVGDVIVTSGLTPIYPKGVLIGRVRDIVKDFSGLSMYALIDPAVDLGALEEVLIIVE